MVPGPSLGRGHDGFHGVGCVRCDCRRGGVEAAAGGGPRGRCVEVTGTQKPDSKEQQPVAGTKAAAGKAPPPVSPREPQAFGAFSCRSRRRSVEAGRASWLGLEAENAPTRREEGAPPSNPHPGGRDRGRMQPAHCPGRCVRLQHSPARKLTTAVFSRSFFRVH